MWPKVYKELFTKKDKVRIGAWYNERDKQDLLKRYKINEEDTFSRPQPLTTESLRNWKQYPPAPLLETPIKLVELKLHKKWRDFLPIALGENIIYFKSQEDFSIMKTTEIGYGRFLNQNFSDVLSPEEIRDLVTERNAQLKAKIENLKWAVTEEEIEWVFSNAEGFVSCASHKEACDPVHQARVYAAGDIHIAYLLNERGKVKARAICWPEKKLIAGHYGATGEIEAILFILGYKHIKHANEMNGAKLKKLVYKNYYIGAHIDKFPRFKDMGEYLVADANGTLGFYLYRCLPPKDYVIPPGGTWFFDNPQEKAA